MALIARIELNKKQTTKNIIDDLYRSDKYV